MEASRINDCISDYTINSGWKVVGPLPVNGVLPSDFTMNMWHHDTEDSAREQAARMCQIWMFDYYVLKFVGRYRVVIPVEYVPSVD